MGICNSNVINCDNLLYNYYLLYIFNYRFVIVCSSGDGSINFPEFLNLMVKDTQLQTESGSELEQLFKLFDRDGDGYITHPEMKRALGESSNYTIQPTMHLTVYCNTCVQTCNDILRARLLWYPSMF